MYKKSNFLIKNQFKKKIRRNNAGKNKSMEAASYSDFCNNSNNFNDYSIEAIKIKANNHSNTDTKVSTSNIYEKR